MAPALPRWRSSPPVEVPGLEAARRLADHLTHSKCCSKYRHFTWAADDVAAPLETAFALVAARALGTFLSLAASGAALSSTALSSPAHH